jgi:hypothetical protein
MRLFELRRDGGKGEMLVWLQERPHYCDRGRWHAGLHIGGFPISDHDPWPRYYFDFEAAKSEVTAYLKAKGVSTEGTAWVPYVESAFSVALGIMNDPTNRSIECTCGVTFLSGAAQKDEAERVLCIGCGKAHGD